MAVPHLYARRGTHAQFGGRSLNSFRGGDDERTMSYAMARNWNLVTRAFSTGITATLQERPGDCICTWVPVEYKKPHADAKFTIKFPAGVCRHHGNLVTIP